MPITRVGTKRKFEEIAQQQTSSIDIDTKMDIDVSPPTDEEIKWRAVFDSCNQTLQDYFSLLENEVKIAQSKKEIADQGAASAKERWNQALRTWNGTKESISDSRNLLSIGLVTLVTAKNGIDMFPSTYYSESGLSNASIVMEVLRKMDLESLDSVRARKMNQICSDYSSCFQKIEKIREEDLSIKNLHEVASGMADFDKFLADQTYTTRD